MESGCSGGGIRSSGSKEEADYVEITLDVRDDSIAVTDVKGSDGGEMGFRARVLHRRPSSVGSLSFRDRMRQVSQDVKRLASFNFNRFSKDDRSSSGAARALLGLKFMSSTVAGDGWSAVEKRFDKLAVDGVLQKPLFGQCIGMKETEEFARELFEALARRRGITRSFVNKQELRQFWEQLVNESFDSKLQTFFDMVDKNADGRITAEEVKEIITLSASANKLSKIKDRADEYTALIMEELDPHNLGHVELYNLEMLLLQVPGDSTELRKNRRDLSRLLSQKLVPTRETNPVRRCYRKTAYFLLDNWKRVWVIALWLAVCAALFAWKFVEYERRPAFHVMGYCVAAAKGAAESLKFNMALILLPVCRNTLTWLRCRTQLGRLLPFDDNINFHKVIAAGIVVGVGVHALAHMACDFPRVLHATEEQYKATVASGFGEERPANYWWFVKGVEGWTGVTMVVLMGVAYTLAQSWLRRGNVKLPKLVRKLTGFNAFWYSHHLFVVVYVLFVVHGICLYLTDKWYEKTTWMYLAFPVTLYACERLVRAFRADYKPVEILEFQACREDVLTLQMSKPRGFKYRSGQYLFVKCGAVSPFEWHPFSMTSAPADEYLSIHIRSAGDWTGRLVSIFSQARQSSTKEQNLETTEEKRFRVPRLLIDGPYGAPAQDYQNYDVLLLVGLGIGATPLISILRSLLHHLKASDPEAAGCGGSRVKKVHFYWVTRGEGSFEWFKEAMNEIADSDRGGVIELHNYCTSVYEEGDARSALIAMLQSLHHAKSGVDIVSGTRVRTHFARPNWRSVLKNVALDHPGHCVGVFYCGPQGPAAELRRLARFFSRQTSTEFEFHKENF